MGRIIQFNAANWQQLINYSAVATSMSENVYVPLNPLASPTFLEKSIIAVSITTTVPPGKTWNFGGTVERQFISGLTIQGNVDASETMRKIWLNKITIILFPNILTKYFLKFYFPKWFKDVNLQCWEYTGIDDTSENTLLTQEFESINLKLDQLLNQ